MTPLKRLDKRILVLVVVVLIAAVLVNVVRSPKEMKTVTAHFPRAVSVYKGTDVRVLGVNVGKVTAVNPEGNSVRVDMEYDADVKVPADAKAVVVTPTLVADRFVQLTPVYKGGAVLADSADIALPDTGVPVELDRIYSSLQSLTQALGPNGVNANGSLNHLLEAGQKAFDGQGARGNQMIHDLADAAKTFGDGAGPLFQTVTYLAKFTRTLAQNDTLVRAFMQDLTGVSAMLAGESDDIEKAVASVSRAVGSVQGFVKNNREALVTDVRKLTDVMTTIASEKDNIQKAVQIAPVAMGNLQMGFDHVSGSQSSRVGIGGYVWDADGFICAIIQQNRAMPTALRDVACDVISALVEPLAANLPWLPPEYDQYVPKPKGAADTRKGLRRPQVQEVAYSTGDRAGSVESLLGGAQ
ncbi:MAG TPA: MCE family protein [Nocardioides sp.]|nr:MCE family protein [Nocardioides sp.]